jgi:hypothetical protein
MIEHSLPDIEVWARSLPDSIPDKRWELATPKDLLEMYERRSANTKATVTTIGRVMRQVGFQQWVGGNKGIEGRIVRKLASRVWVLSKKQETIEAYNAITSESEIHKRYEMQRRQPTMEEIEKELQRKGQDV